MKTVHRKVLTVIELCSNIWPITRNPTALDTGRITVTVIGYRIGYLDDGVLGRKSVELNSFQALWMFEVV